jgi:hypothetical protein
MTPVPHIKMLDEDRVITGAVEVGKREPIILNNDLINQAQGPAT